MIEKIELRGKALVIFTRETSPYWYCRIKLDGHPPVSLSLKVEDRTAAEFKAQDLFGELQHKARRGQPLISKPFKTVAKRFLNWMKERVEREEITRGSYINAKSKFERYYIPYFGEIPLDDINTRTIEAFQDWRKSYWTSGPGKNTDTVTYERPNPKRKKPDRIVRKHVATKQPTNSTLRHEVTDLRLFFKQAVMWGYIEPHNVPVIKGPPNKPNRRPNFTREEYKHLVKTAYTRMKDEQHARVKHDKMMLYCWVEILGHTGMRVGEARNLKWKDIRIHQTEDGQKVVQMWVSGKGKKRELIAMPETRFFLDMIRAKTKPKTDDKFVFVRKDGSQIQRFNNGFKTLLKAAGLVKDNYGNKRTPYSLRHTYATFALIEGRVNVYTLAVNMGTSVEMIEQYYGHVKPLQAYKELTKRYRL